MNFFLLQSEAQSISGEGSTLWKLAKPIMSRLGFGGILGWSVGFLLKKSLKLLAILVALCFIGLQFLISRGYIQSVDWLIIAQDFKAFFNEDFFTNLSNLLLLNLPFGAGFIVGLLLGFKMG
jgi:uncharacterized membrane protein (Fun14 family)